jgi:hypothetical protein
MASILRPTQSLHLYIYNMSIAQLIESSVIGYKYQHKLHYSSVDQCIICAYVEVVINFTIVQKQSLHYTRDTNTFLFLILTFSHVQTVCLSCVTVL